MNDLTVPPLLQVLRKIQTYGKILLLASALALMVGGTLPFVLLFGLLFLLGATAILASTLMALIVSKREQIFWYKKDFYPVTDDTRAFYRQFRIRNWLSLGLLSLYTFILIRIFILLILR